MLRTVIICLLVETNGELCAQFSDIEKDMNRNGKKLNLSFLLVH
jgi:hypothetical protein